MEGFRYAMVAMMNPRRADAVAKTGELFMKRYNDMKLQQIYYKMQTNKIGRRILKEEPVVTSDLLVPKYPEGSLGAHYVEFMDTHGFTLNRPPLTTKLEHPYVLMRYRQIHDFNHILFNLPATVHGESILKWVEYQQLELTMPFFAGIVGIYYNLGIDDIQYGVQQGYSSDFMMNIYYEEHLNENLDSLRKKFNIQPYNSKIN